MVYYSTKAEIDLTFKVTLYLNLHFTLSSCYSFQAYLPRTWPFFENPLGTCVQRLCIAYKKRARSELRVFTSYYLRTMHRGLLYSSVLPLGPCISPSACGRDIFWNAGAGYNNPDFHNLTRWSTHDQWYGCESLRHECLAKLI